MNQLADSLTTIRLSLHVLAACVWVGGQIVMLGLLPDVRRLGGEAQEVLPLAEAVARLATEATPPDLNRTGAD